MLRKYEISPLRLLQGEVDKLFEQSFLNTTSTHWMPDVDIAETDNELVLTAEMAGLSPDDFDLIIENNELILKGHKKIESNDDSKNYHRVERRYGSFTRSFRLPQTVDTNNIHAEFKNGVLRVAMSKKESVKARKIQVIGESTEPKSLSAKASS